MAIIAIVILLAFAGQSTIAPKEGYHRPRPTGAVRCAKLTEASGLAAGRDNPGVLWTHNDSGDGPYVYALSERGEHLATVRLAGASSRDWEDMAVGPGPVRGRSYLYLGDIGDNHARRTAIRVYRVFEPRIDDTPKPFVKTLRDFETITLRYPDGPRDAETLLVDPIGGDLYVISKREFRGRVYCVKAKRLRGGGPIRMQLVTKLPWGFLTGGDVSPDGREVMLRGYFAATRWSRRPGEPLWKAFTRPGRAAPVPWERLGEALAYAADGQGYYTLSEGPARVIYRCERVGAEASGRGRLHFGCPTDPIRLE